MRISDLSVIGSSPRLRGTRSRRRGLWTFSRFIPAPAGNTCAENGHSAQVPVHPRACGEHMMLKRREMMLPGSSPRLRGTPRHVGADRQPLRFIPAPAGNTGRWWRASLSETVHPRACGEHRTINENAARIPGSSPRLRGTPHGPASRDLPPRFIPAPAGNTNPLFRFRFPRRGSSPRLRGTPRRAQYRRTQRRFIPAPAGNTRPYVDLTTFGAVHPRACGEHAVKRILHEFGNGSSPRLRGTHADPRKSVAIFRFIPAPAGNTPSLSRSRPVTPVHPRACGEHL